MNQLAKSIIDIATGETPEPLTFDAITRSSGLMNPLLCWREIQLYHMGATDDETTILVA